MRVLGNGSDQTVINTAIIILTVVLVLNILAPFAVYYAISLARKGDFNSHKKIQDGVIFVCLLGVLILEGLIRVSEGSGSLAQIAHTQEHQFSDLLSPHTLSEPYLPTFYGPSKSLLPIESLENIYWESSLQPIRQLGMSCFSAWFTPL